VVKEEEAITMDVEIAEAEVDVVVVEEVVVAEVVVVEERLGQERRNGSKQLKPGPAVTEKAVFRL
jgi:hypothetical protein